MSLLFWVLYFWFPLSLLGLSQLIAFLAAVERYFDSPPRGYTHSYMWG